MEYVHKLNTNANSMIFLKFQCASLTRAISSRYKVRAKKKTNYSEENWSTVTLEIQDSR